MATSGPRFAASFDEVAWAQDVIANYPEGSRARAVASRARREFTRAGVPAKALRPCEDDGPDRTRLGGCLKVYLPLTAGAAAERPFGMVFAPIVRSGGIVLELVAFGVRHQPRGARAPTLYEIAHRRLHGSWP